MGVQFAWEEMYAQFAGVDMLVYIFPHSDPSKIASNHVDNPADALVSLGTVEFYNDNEC